MIKDLPINTNGRLTSDARKQLMLIINEEFQNKASLYHQLKEREREKILEKYKAEVGFQVLSKKHQAISDKIAIAQRDLKLVEFEIEDLGLDIEGRVGTAYRHMDGKQVKNKGYEKLNRLLEAIDKNSPSENLKHKLISRLMLSFTIGEANEIMREVLGNGIIPQVDVKAITFQEK